MLTCQWIKESSLTDIKGQGTMAPRLLAQRHSAECHFDGWRSAFWMVNYTGVSTVTVLFRLCHSDECHSAECRGAEWEQLKANQSIGNVFTLNFSSWRCSKLFIQKKIELTFSKSGPLSMPVTIFFSLLVARRAPGLESSTSGWGGECYTAMLWLLSLRATIFAFLRKNC
jgi:hypothetical protein